MAYEAVNDGVTAAGRYAQLEQIREPYLERARDCARVTIPGLVPPKGFTPQSKLYVPFQGVGSRGVNNLAAKLLLSLLPPNTPFFKLVMDDYSIERLNNNQNLRATVDAALSKIERAVQDYIEMSAIRVAVAELLKILIVAGNVLLFLNPLGGVRVFKLTDYVIKRDLQGNPLEIITKESVSKAALPDEIRQMVADEDTKPATDAQGNPVRSAEDNVDLYTWIKRVGNAWQSHQEVCGQKVPGSEGSYPLDKTPYLPMRWTRIDGEDYGRSYVEEYLGDLYSLEGLSKAIVQGSAAAAKVLILVKPGSSTNAQQVARKPTGSVIPGNQDDVGVLQMQKYADFRIAKETIDAITERLSFAFLLNSSIQRKGERVTAEEIRYMARELEDALGGVFSVLSMEFQYPLIQRLMYVLERAHKLPALPKGFVKPVIVTGIDALGRGQDFTKLQTFIGAAIELLGAEQAIKYVNPSDALTRLGAAIGITTDGLVKTEDQVKAEMAQMMQMQMMQQLGPNAINALGGMGKQAMADQAQANLAANEQAPPAAEGEPETPTE